jgi:hypothetical protein
MSITYVYILYVWMYEGAYTVSRAEAICHAIAASGAKKVLISWNTWEFFICFPWYMEIFPGVFNGCMNNFHGNISMALNTNTANSVSLILGSQVQIPNGTKTICKVRRFNTLYKYFPLKRLKLKSISNR